MSESLFFHGDFYRRDALDAVVRSFEARTRVVSTMRDGGVGIELASSDAALRAEFTNAALHETLRLMREHAPGSEGAELRAPTGEPRGDLAQLVAPHTEGSALGLGWVLDSIGPLRDGALTLGLRQDGPERPATPSGLEGPARARAVLHRNAGAPLGVAHTDELDFFVMNGGAGSARTDLGIARVLAAMAQRMRAVAPTPERQVLLAALRTHAERGAAAARPAVPLAQTSARRTSASGPSIVPVITNEPARVRFEFDEAGSSRLVLYDALLELTACASVLLERAAPGRIAIELRPVPQPSGPPASTGGVTSLAELARAGARVLDTALEGAGTEAAPRAPRGAVPNEDLEALVAELHGGDPSTLGLDFVPEPGPGHDQLRVLNLRGTGACDSDCLFCVEKFDATHRAVSNADATQQLIARAAGDFDVVFFASGEPTIHPKLFEYVASARAAGFRSFGMSSHFRSFADPAFARRVLEAGFQYFDISLHAADPVAQLEVNPIGDEGRSLAEALKGLAVLYRLARALGVRITITHKLVVSRLNADALEAIVEATYRRGVRSFIVQPVRTGELAMLRRSKLDMREDEMLEPLNRLLAWAAARPGVVVKPYGFSRFGLLPGAQLATERNRVKNVYGRARHHGPRRELPPSSEARPADGRHWVELMTVGERRHGFAHDGASPVLDGALERGLDLSFGCRMGACGMCAARLLEGEVDQSSQRFLTDEQVREGYVLLCQACPRSDVLVRVCGEDEIEAL